MFFTWTQKRPKAKIDNTLGKCQTVCKPGSVPVNPRVDRKWPFIWDARYRTPRATYPDNSAEMRLRGRAPMPSLLGLAPGGVCRAGYVAITAVRSYRTLSPLPADLNGRGRRFAFCGTFPRVAPAGR